MTNQARFTINSLLEGKSALEKAAPAVSTESPPVHPTAGPCGSKGLGLEIETAGALPDSEDYVRHDFYLANFTPSEIAYCTQQAETKAALQGLLAAKRAIIKSGAASKPADGLRSLEISFDHEGRPIHPGCLLSITHNGAIAAAVCFWFDGISWLTPAAGGAVVRSHIVKFPLKTRVFAFLILLSLLILFGFGLWKILELFRP